jgi:hypothetical protein
MCPFRVLPILYEIKMRQGNICLPCPVDILTELPSLGYLPLWRAHHYGGSFFRRRMFIQVATRRRKMPGYGEIICIFEGRKNSCLIHWFVHKSIYLHKTLFLKSVKFCSIVSILAAFKGAVHIEKWENCSLLWRGNKL